MAFVYILCNPNKTVLYTGVTNDLERRLQEHRKGSVGSFTSRYNCVRLVYFEETPSMIAAIEEEKRIKSGSRKKKIDRITSQNPDWTDLSENWNL